MNLQRLIHVFSTLHLRHSCFTVLAIAVTMLMVWIEPILCGNPLVCVPQGDPSAHIYEGKLFIYGKRDRRCRPNSNDPSWTCFSTTDLENWTDHEDIFHIDDIPWAKSHAFAPDCAFKNGTYYLYAPCQDQDQDGNRTWYTAIGTSSKPEGPFQYQARIDIHEIDPSTFIDDDAQAYIYYPARLGKLADNMLETDGEWVPREDYLIGGPIDPQKHTTWENPFVFKREGRYYYLLSVCDLDENGKRLSGQSVHHWIGDSPTGPFEYHGCIYRPTSGNCGSSIIEYQDQWLFFYHKTFYSPDMDCHERKPCMEICRFQDDGTIEFMEATADPQKCQKPETDQSD